MKRMFALLIFSLISIDVSAITVEDIKMPLPVEYRLGTSNEIEKKYEIIETNLESQDMILQKEKDAVKRVTYADLTLNNISKDIVYDLKIEQKYVMEDIKTLWIGAASRSETVKFAIYKLSNPDEDKPSNNILKKVIRPLANISSLAGLGIPDPIVGSVALMGGNLLTGLSISDKDLNYKYSKVTDSKSESSKAMEPIVVTRPGMVIDFRPLFSNTREPNFVTLGISTLVMAQQRLKQ